MKKIICPLLRQACIEDGGLMDGELCGCPFWVYIRGKDPQTQGDIDHKGCAIAWMPILMIENSKEQRSTAKEVETLRNEMMPQTEALNGMMGQLVGAAINGARALSVKQDAPKVIDNGPQPATH